MLLNANLGLFGYFAVFIFNENMICAICVVLILKDVILLKVYERKQIIKKKLPEALMGLYYFLHELQIQKIISSLQHGRCAIPSGLQYVIT